MNGAPDDAVQGDAPNEPATRTALAGRLRLLLPLLVLVVSVAVVWYFAGLNRLDAQKLAQLAEKLRGDPAAIFYVWAAFAVGTLLFFPVTALMGATMLAFDPWRGFAFAYSGTLLGACITYGAGRLLGARALEYIAGPRLSRFGTLLRTHAIRASIAARLLPVGNFTVINLFAGSLRIPFVSFFLGNLVGILPGAVFLALFAERLSNALRKPSAENLTYLGLALVVATVVIFVVRRRRKSATEALAD